MQTTHVFHNASAPVDKIRNLPGLHLQALQGSEWITTPAGLLQLAFDVDLDAPAGSWIVPCLSATGAGPYSYRASVTLSDGQQSDSFDLVRIGDDTLGKTAFARAVGKTGVLGKTEDDYVSVAQNSRCRRIVVDIMTTRPEVLKQAPVIVSVAVLRSLDIHATASVDAVIDIPPCSQMEQPEQIRSRICSPTSIAMGLRHFGIKADPVAVAQQAYHADLDLYGVWPSSLYAASQYGVMGLISGISSAADIADMADRNIPIAASISYQDGALSGSAIKSTSGHLVIVSGIDARGIVVNDPAAPDHTQVHRHYKTDEFLKAWSNKKGLGYLMLGPA